MLFVCLVLLTCAGQRGNDDMSFDMRQEITQGLQGVTIAGSCCFCDFETCEEIDARKSNVRLLA